MDGRDRDHYFRHRLRRGQLVTARDDVLVKAATGKRVVHVGCVDWPVTSERMKDGSLLHPKLLQSAERVLGIDIDQAGMDALASQLGGEYRNIDLTDASVDVSAIEDFGPELIIAGDVIEHVPSAQGLLEGLRRIAMGTKAPIMVTTPNSLAFRSTVNTALGLELMHPDHVAVYSPKTLETLVNRSGLVVTSWQYYTISTGTDPGHRIYDGVSRAAARLRSAWSDGHIVTCVSA